jgi:WD40 repeat protein
MRKSSGRLGSVFKGATKAPPTRQPKPRWGVDLPEAVLAVRWAPDAHSVLAATAAGSTIVLSAEDGETIASLTEHPGGALSLDVSPDGTVAVSGGQDGRVRFHDLATHKQILDDRGDARNGWVEHVAFAPDGSFVATAAGKTVRFWSPRGEFISEVTGLTSTVAAIAWARTSTGFDLLAACYGGIQRLAPRIAAPTASLLWKGSIVSVSPSPDGKYIAAGTQESMVLVWTPIRPDPLKMEGYPRKTRELAWTADSLQLATGGASSIVLWGFGGKGPQGTTGKQLGSHGDLISSLAVVQRDGMMLSGARNGMLAGWSAASTKPLFSLSLSGAVELIQLSADERAFASASDNGELTVWDL